MQGKIIGLIAENIKKIKAVNIKPEGDWVEITGRNDQGKTTVLDCISWAFAGKDAVQKAPIRNGEDNALIKVDMGDLIVERRFIKKDDGSFSTTVKVKNKEGMTHSSPQTVLDKFYGKFCLDPLAFSRMESRGQYNFIRRLCPVAVDIDKLDADYKTLFAERTDINRWNKQLESQISGIDVPEGTPDEKMSIAELTRELEEIQTHNATIEKTKDVRDTLLLKKQDAAQKIKELERQILLLKDECEKCDISLRQVMDVLATRRPKDATEIRIKISAADTVNANVASLLQRKELEGKLNAGAKKAETLSDRLEAIQAAKKAAIEKAALPVKGLTFGDGELLFNGVPFEQLSASSRLKVSLEIAAAEKPELRVILVRDASLLDEGGRQTLKDFAKEKGYQIWVELVDSTGEIGFVIEDGKLKGAENGRQ